MMCYQNNNNNNDFRTCTSLFQLTYPKCTAITENQQ